MPPASGGPLPPLLLAALTLLLPVLVGVVLGAVRLFPEPERAIDVLNRLALYVAFPLLIVVGLVDRDFAVPAEPAFFVVIPVVAVLGVGILWQAGWFVDAVRDSLGPLALTTVWGNVAYLGLPVVAAVLGPSAVGLAGLAVAIHVLVAMLLGPTLLITFSGGSARGALGRAVRATLRQPLAWAPVVGLAARWLPAGVLDAVLPVVTPLARMAGPLALVLIGLFLFTWRARLRPDGRAVAPVLAKLVLVPALTAALVIPLSLAELLTPLQGRLLLVLSAMPTAISTFALAREFRIGQERVALAIITSTALSVGLLPVLAWALQSGPLPWE
jgi:malonate transporter and related proteins